MDSRTHCLGRFSHINWSILRLLFRWGACVFSEGAHWQTNKIEAPIVEEEETENEMPNGIPGFPLAALLIGIVTLSYLNRSTRRLRPS
jgi:hypothetical protein